MTNRYLMSVAAAALIAGTGFASAQGTREAPSSGAAPTQQQSAPPSERGSAATPMNRDSSQSGAPAEAPKSAQSNEKTSPQGAKNQRAQDDMKAGAKGEKSAQDNNMKGERSKSMSSENEKAGASKDMKAEDRSGNMNRAEDRNGAAKSTTTTGQAGAGAKLSTEQRTKITTVFKSQHVQPVTNVNFSISVGTHVPRNVGFHPLPAEIVTIYPEWRGYEFFLVNNQIIVVNPRTLEIVEIIDA
ncbi:DUF1236 domain-containing protein [Bradyrhizobium sp.]